MSAWKALVGRISLFPGSPPAVSLPSALDLYSRVWSANPDNFQSSPNALMPSFATGKRGGLTVACSVHPTRIDFSLNPPPVSREGSGASFVLIEDTNQFHAELVRLVNFIGSGGGIANTVSRVGINLHFLTLIANIEEANKVLTTVMPEQYRPRIKDEEDFIFQINRPHTSREVEGVRINYVTKWSIDRFQMFNITINVNIPVIDSRGVPSQKGEEFIAASVVFDHNNVPVNFSLDGKQQSSLLLESLTAAKEMQREIGLNVEGF
jgi:hypothetical protein